MKGALLEPWKDAGDQRGLRFIQGFKNVSGKKKKVQRPKTTGGCRKEMTVPFRSHSYRKE